MIYMPATYADAVSFILFYFSRRAGFDARLPLPRRAFIIASSLARDDAMTRIAAAYAFCLFSSMLLAGRWLSIFKNSYIPIEALDEAHCRERLRR